MAVTYEPIASTTLGSAAGTITFSSIPGTYTDLVLVVLAQSAIAGSGSTFVYRFNGDTGANYSYTQLRGNGSAAASLRESSITLGVMALPLIELSSSLDNIAVMHVMSYANTNVNKTSLSLGASAGRGVDRIVSLWRSTSAVTSITISNGGFFPSVNFASGTTASLYGIKAA